MAGALFTAEFIALFESLRFTTAARATVFIYAAPFFAALGAAFLLKDERLKPIQWAGLGLAFLGVACGLGACLLNPGEMGFEPLKPVGELDAANSRIRFDVRVEALRPSFVAPFPRWRSSAGCECGQGRGPPLGELQDIVGEADEAPLVGDLLDAAQEKLTEAARLLDLSEHRLGQLLS